MEYFLDRYQTPNLNQYQINYLNSPITTKEIEADIRSLPNKQTNKKPRTRWVYQTFKKDLIPILSKIFHRIETEGTTTDLFFEATIMLIPKPHKDPTKKEYFRTISPMNAKAKILNKILSD